MLPPTRAAVNRGPLAALQCPENIRVIVQRLLRLEDGDADAPDEHHETLVRERSTTKPLRGPGPLREKSSMH